MKVNTLIFSVLGVGLLIGAVYSANNSYEFKNAASLTQGKVVDYIKRRSNDGTTYAPVIEFVTEKNTTVEFTSSSSSSYRSYSIGDKIDVLYLENNPNNARINSFMSLWFLPIILGFIGSVFFGIGLYAYLQNKKGKIVINVKTLTLKPGEEFNGDVNIQLFKNTEINSFVISIIGQEIISYRRRGRRRQERRKIYEKGMKPIINKSFPAGYESTHQFNFMAPNPAEFVSIEDASKQSIMNKMIDFFRREERKVEWYISAVVDAKGIDLDNKEQIFIHNYGV